MGFITELAKSFIGGYVDERGIEGTLEDVGDLVSGVGKIGKKLFGDEESDSDLCDDEDELDYCQEVQSCLDNDGQITNSERKLLNRLRVSLDISEERANELEAYLIKSNNAEREYKEALENCLKDGQISESERRLLERLRESLNIAEDRAAEIEASLLGLDDAEKEYVEELKACMVDGSISESEHHLLGRLRKSLGISEQRAEELEKKYIIGNMLNSLCHKQ